MAAATAAQPISLDYREVNKLIYAGHFLTTIYEIDVDGTKQRVIPRDYQLDRIKDHPVHVDFLRLRPGTTLRVNVPVHFINQDISPGIKKGGALNVVRHTIELKVPADSIPEAITVDLSELDIAESVHISAITLPAGCTPTDMRHDFTIATIAPPACRGRGTDACRCRCRGGAAAAAGAAAPGGAPATPRSSPLAAAPRRRADAGSKGTGRYSWRPAKEAKIAGGQAPFPSVSPATLLQALG